MVQTVPYRMHPALRAPAKLVKRREVERLRESIPVDQYLQLMDHAIRTGEMPILDPETGRPRKKPGGGIQCHEIEAKDRLDLIKYLIDKRMPKIKQVEVTKAGTADDEDMASAIEHQDSEALRRIVDADHTVVPANPFEDE